MIHFEKVNDEINENDLKIFEDTLGLTLPKDYKAHMLKYNGGEPESYGVYFGEQDNGVNLSYFHPLKYGDDSLEEYLSLREDLPSNYISIGATITGGICMSLDEKDYGSIFVYYEDLNPEKLATSFSEFINGLIDYEGYNESI